MSLAIAAGMNSACAHRYADSQIVSAPAPDVRAESSHYPVSQTDEGLPPLPTPRTNLGVGAVDGQLYAVGGKIGEEAVAVVESYDPKSRRWTRRASMLLPRFGVKICVGEGKLFALGGSTRDLHYLTDVQAYDPQLDRWSVRASLPRRLAGTVCGVYSDKLYFLGIVDVSPWDVRTLRRDISQPIQQYNAPLVLDIKSDTWALWNAPPQLIGGGYRGAGAVIKEKLYLLIEGGGGDALQVVDLQTNRFSSAAFSGDIYRPGVSVVYGKSIYNLGGGFKEENDAAVVAYNTQTGRRTLEKPLQFPRRAHGAAVIDDTIFIVGGTVNGSPSDIFEAYRPWDASDSEATSPAPARPNDFALVVGVEKYRGLPNAKYAGRDAESMRLFLARTMGVPEKNIITLLDDKAGMADIGKILDEWLPRNVTIDSRLYFYFSGHGTANLVDGVPYLLPWDGDLSFLRGSAYSVETLIEKLRASKARETIAMLETCFSETGSRCVQPRGLRPLIVRGGANSIGHSGINVIFAASLGETAGVNEARGHGIFTTEAISRFGNIKGSRGGATLNKWFDATKRGVVSAAKKLDSKQTPQLIIEKDFLLSR